MKSGGPGSNGEFWNLPGIGKDALPKPVVLETVC
jgi:hypothetical protein